MEDTSIDLAGEIAAALNLPKPGVAKTLELMTEGATIPFLARYRKEATGGLDEVALANILERRDFLNELLARRKTILETIESQGQLTPALKAQILATRSKTELEDLYLPYKPKRRTRASIARERGLEPLGDLLFAQTDPAADPAALAAAFVDPAKEVPDAAAAWAGARDIVAERVAEDADVRATLRALAQGQGVLRAKERPPEKEKRADGTPIPDEAERLKFKDYFDYSEPVASIPSHRALALRRGEKERILRVILEVDRDAALGAVSARTVKAPAGWPLRGELERALTDSWDRLLAPSIEVDVRLGLKEAADAAAIQVFAENLRHLLMAAPFGGKPTIGVDPGFRTGCKVVALDCKGDLVDNDVIFPHEGRRGVDAKVLISAWVKAHGAKAIAVGNGTAGRETLAFIREIKTAGAIPDDVIIVSVNESGASVYSASDVAREEFPDHDITVRGAVSIGRRLQDPLAELVKIDPKAIGVGQYQHDVHQPALKRSLDGVVASCVNRVGVDVNTASARLLGYVAGIGETVAQNIVAYRAQKGVLKSRRQLLEVPRLGPKAFEQAAGFLRIRSGEHPLDGSGVHPESYDVVERMADDLGLEVDALVGNANAARKIDPKKYVDDKRGEPTIRDILAELEKPGRDPRQGFEEIGFRDDVTELDHLSEGMALWGVVTNVTAFGAFVDVGVHQDGLVHLSELSIKFIKEPSEVVKVGDRVRVKVIALDKLRKRIGLSVKQLLQAATPGGAQGAGGGAPQRSAQRPERAAGGGGGGSGGGPRPAGQSGPSGGGGQQGKKPLSHSPFASIKLPGR